MKNDDEVLRKTVKVHVDHGSIISETAYALSLARSTVRERLKAATARGIHPSIMGDTLPEGMQLDALSSLYKVKDMNGNMSLQWVKAKQAKEAEVFMAAMERTFAKYKGIAEPLPPVMHVSDDDLLVVYIIADLHLGMYAWKAEAGEDYDLNIASKMLIDKMGQLIARAPAAAEALILNLGDYFHSDSNKNRTERSDNALDVDSRYSKVLNVGSDLMVQAVHMALQKHRHVSVRNLPGNHDARTTPALNRAMEYYFHNEPRVSIDPDPGPFFFKQFGKVMIGATHGDQAKPEGFAGIMAAKEPEMWGQTEYRVAYFGHVHRKEKGGGDKAGVTWESFQTLAPRDAWGNNQGFTAGRSMQAIVLHADKGEYDRITEPVKGPR